MTGFAKPAHSPTLPAVRFLRCKIRPPWLRDLALATLAFSVATACKRATPPAAAEAPAAAPDPKVLAAARELAAVLDKALTAYNAGDQAALFADFASTATPAPGDRIFTELFEGYYKAEFGKITALRLDTKETVPDPEAGSSSISPSASACPSRKSAPTSSAKTARRRSCSCGWKKWRWRSDPRALVTSEFGRALQRSHLSA